MLEKRQDGSFRLKYSNEQITMPDLRIGEYQIELNTLLTSSTFYIKTKDKWSTNFLFSAVVANPKGDVIVENEVGNQLTRSTSSNRFTN
jgi:hypothetical protein